MAHTKTFSINEAFASFPVLRPTINKAQKAGLALRHVTAVYNNNQTRIIQYKIMIGEINPENWTHEELKGWLSVYGEPKNPKTKKSTAKKQKYEIPVLRIGYACKTIKVTATSQEEAEEKALDEAGNYEFSEHSSEYQLDY